MAAAAAADNEGDDVGMGDVVV